MIIIMILLSCSASAFFSSQFDFRNFDNIIGGADEDFPGADPFLQNFYLETFQGNECADTYCTAVESGNETDCKCKDLAPGEMCLDVFVNSTASETGAILGSEAKDYCLDETNIMEGFVQCAYLDNAYWVQIQCPAHFICFDGACIHELNTSIGRAENIQIDDNGTIVHADYITINGVEIHNITNLVIGANDSIVSADELTIDNIDMVNITYIKIHNDSIDLGYAELEDWIIQNAVNMTIQQTKDMLNISASMLEIISPIDGSIMRFIDIEDMTIRFDGELHINATRIDVIIGFDIPNPPYVRIIGNDTSIRVKLIDGYLEYHVKNAWLYFDGGDFVEKVWAAEGSTIRLSYQTGIFCVVLGKDAHYTYSGEESYRIVNAYSDKYEFCIDRPGAKIDSYDGIDDGSLNLRTPIKYERPVNGSYSHIYDSRDDSMAVIEDGVHIKSKTQLTETEIYSSDYMVFEDGNRYAVVTGSRPPYLSEYQESQFAPEISINDGVLVQNSQSNTVSVYSKPEYLPKSKIFK